MYQICKILAIFALLSFSLIMSGCNKQDMEEDITTNGVDNQALVTGDCIVEEGSKTIEERLLENQSWTYKGNEERPIFLVVVSVNEDLDGQAARNISMDLSQLDSKVDGVYVVAYSVEDAAEHPTRDIETLGETVSNSEGQQASAIIYPYLTWWKVYGSSVSVESCCLVRNCYIDLQLSGECMLLNISD